MGPVVAFAGILLIRITVALSIVVHSSTDVLVARWFEEEEEEQGGQHEPAPSARADGPDGVGPPTAG